LRLSTVCRHKLFDKDRSGSSMTALRTLSSHRRGDLSHFHGDSPFLAISREISPQTLRPDTAAQQRLSDKSTKQRAESRQASDKP
jgi:hypothetical protein